jgi:hypothetical protein
LANTYGHWITSAKEEKKKLTAIMAKLEEKKTGDEMVLQIYHSTLPEVNIFDPNYRGYMYNPYGDMNLYDNYNYYLKDSSQRQPSWLDHIFRYNWSRVQAYQRFKSEIGLERLKDTEMRFVALYEKIMAQPESEREYETDISFDTPFLEPL